MVKERHWADDIPLGYRILIVIWLIGLVLTAALAHNYGIQQNNPWPFLQTLAIGDVIGAIIIIAGLIAAYRNRKRAK